MATKRNHRPNAVKAECNKCGHEAAAPVGTKHRRCPGDVALPLRTAGEQLVPAKRGSWQAR